MSEAEPVSSGGMSTFVGTACFGSGTVRINVDLAGPAGEHYSLYGGSDDMDPRTRSAALSTSRDHPSNHQLAGAGRYTASRSYTVQVTYKRGSTPMLKTASVAAANAVDGSTAPLTFS